MRPRSATFGTAAQTPQPLRIFIRSGPKSHAPGAHDYPRFLKEWVPLLNERGAKATGADTFPTKAQLDETDVLILHKQEAGNIEEAERKNLNEFLARGGGLVVIHAGLVSSDPDWFKTIVGGSWRNGTAKWLEGPMHLYFTDRDSPITKDASNWEMDDEIYYDLDMMPEAADPRVGVYAEAAGARNANFQRRADELTGGGKNGRASTTSSRRCGRTSRRSTAAARRIARSCPFPDTGTRTSTGRTTARFCCAASRGRASDRISTSSASPGATELGDALRYPEGGPTAPGEGGGEDRSASGLRPVARRRRAAHRQGDEHRLG